MNIELGTIAFIVLIGIVIANPGIAIPTWVIVFLAIVIFINIASLTYDIMRYKEIKKYLVC